MKDKDVSIRLTPQQACSEELIRKALHLGPSDTYTVIRRSTDARRRDVFIDLLCRINPSKPSFTPVIFKDADPRYGQVLIAGSGPGGLFAALTLLEHGIKPVVFERGKDVHSRRVDIAKISTQDKVDPFSNYSFGEGGAGTYSDGKLFTRSRKRGDNSRILELFVQFGAPASILYDAHPHIGTDRLPSIIENMRRCIISHGGEVHFSTLVTDLIIEGSSVKGCTVKDLVSGEESSYNGPVILAVGNAARDTYRMALSRGIAMQSKGLAMGVRIEHPQHLIDCIQYHNPSGRGPYLPPAEYNYAVQASLDGRKTGVYSFCMCPGGFVVPAASDVNQTVVNGMSPSNRGGKFANSGLVVEFPADGLEFSDPLSVMKYQEELEYRTFLAAGRTQKAPAQRVTDFLRGRTSSSLPATSYTPGLSSFNLEEVLPGEIALPLKEGLNLIGRRLHGYITEESILIGTETRTSGPVRFLRDESTLESLSHSNLYPCGEGAGFAGGIVSSAIDGMRCALSICAREGLVQE
ncbi:MAG: FAD-binding protein [Sphaerochaetaceae bacterium]|nr:FAD-binding protein [Sphaerochaetaceae bacterium]